MLPNEKISDDLKSWPRHEEYLLPLAWAGSIVTLARQEGRIPDDQLSISLQDKLHNFRTQCSVLSGYDWFINPLVFTQVLIFYLFIIYYFKRKRTIFRCFQQYFLFTFVFHWFVHQVVTFTVCCFYAAALMGRQLMGAQTELHILSSFISILGIQFLFCMCCFNDDDFETNMLINRNLQVIDFFSLSLSLSLCLSYFIVVPASSLWYI